MVGQCTHEPRRDRDRGRDATKADRGIISKARSTCAEVPRVEILADLPQPRYRPHHDPGAVRLVSNSFAERAVSRLSASQCHGSVAVLRDDAYRRRSR